LHNLAKKPSEDRKNYIKKSSVNKPLREIAKDAKRTCNYIVNVVENVLSFVIELIQ